MKPLLVILFLLTACQKPIEKPPEKSKPQLTAKEQRVKDFGRTMGDYTWRITTGPQFIKTLDSLGTIYHYPLEIYEEIDKGHWTERMESEETKQTQRDFLDLKIRWLRYMLDEQKRLHLEHRND